ncbi:MAG: ABC transporter permease [Desulfovibrionaceae bacterium]|nr:ABC transporter permease [Desulfovibrionaceae bacterium]
MRGRVFTLVLKELLMIFRDKKARMSMIAPVIIQSLLFPFAATLEITNAALGIYSEDSGRHALELTQRLAESSAFSELLILRRARDIAEVIDNQKALLVMRFPEDFSRSVEAGQEAQIQVLLDGRRSNGAQIAFNYVQSVLGQYQRELLDGLGGEVLVEIDPAFRDWYNPNLDYKWFVLPSLVALITTVGVLIVTALSVAREREQGTLEQLLVSPLSTWQIFVGKAVPAVIVATVQGSIVLAAGMFFYRIPFAGSIPLFYCMIVLYGLSLVGVGLLISSLCNTQQQAFIGVFLFMMPAILLSGYISPVENMPLWLQQVTMINPVRHFTEITKQIYLKDAGIHVLWQSIWPMLAIIAGSTAIAYAMFRRKVA